MILPSLRAPILDSLSLPHPRPLFRLQEGVPLRPVVDLSFARKHQRRLTSLSRVFRWYPGVHRCGVVSPHARQRQPLLLRVHLRHPRRTSSSPGDLPPRRAPQDVREPPSPVPRKRWLRRSVSSCCCCRVDGAATLRRPHPGLRPPTLVAQMPPLLTVSLTLDAERLA